MKDAISKIPKVWFAILLYFCAVELIVLFTKPVLFLDTRFVIVRAIFLTTFLLIFFLKDRISAKNFHFVNAILTFALMSFLYKETAILNTLIFPKIDGFLSEIDFKIFGFQPSVEFSKQFNSLFYSELFYFGYFCYYLLPIVVLALLYRKFPQKIEEFGFVLVTSFLLYYFIFIIIPAEGPQFYFPFPENQIEAKGIFGTLVKLVQKSGEVPTAAFPSSHVGMAWIVVFWLFRNLKNSVKYFLPFVILLMFSTVYIKAHYFIDVVFGVISAPIVFFLTFSFYKFFKKQNQCR